MATGTFGYYGFEGLQSGQTHTVTENTTRYEFAVPTRTITPQGDITDLNFVAEP